MLPYLYAEINIFAVLILLLILFKVLGCYDMQNNQRLFVRVLLSNIFLFLIDFLWVFIEYDFLHIPYPLSYTFNRLLNGMYFIQSGITGYSWFIYSESMQQSKVMRRKKFMLISTLPLLLLIIMTLCSYKTGWLFYIDKNNVYHRGKYYIIQLLIACGYIVFTSIKALILAFRKESYGNNQNYITLASFVFLPILFGVLQTLMPGLPLVCIGITLSLLYVYLGFQEQRISIDPLTQLNNRNQLLKYLSSKIMHYDDTKKLYLLMMDIDYFKSINDRFGHIEGDKALIRVAEALKQVCGNQCCFVSRFGGDEFILICEVENSSEIDSLCHQINDSIKRVSVEEKVPYVLSLSIGYAEYERSVGSIQEFISLADNELYKVKRARKS